MAFWNRCVLVMAASLSSLGVQAAERPNVIVMVADDLGWNDIGFHGGDIDTPSLDRLAKEGVELNRFYTTPICSPTRAAIMTGRNPIRLGVAYGVILPWDNTGIHPDEHFMPQSFLSAGYQTAMVGKWHLGHAQQTYHPNNRGFEHFYGHLHAEVGFFPPFTNQGGKDFQRNGESIDDQGYETFLLAKEASRYIRERDKDKPVFCICPLLLPWFLGGLQYEGTTGIQSLNLLGRKVMGSDGKLLGNFTKRIHIFCKAHAINNAMQPFTIADQTVGGYNSRYWYESNGGPRRNRRRICRLYDV